MASKVVIFVAFPIVMCVICVHFPIPRLWFLPEIGMILKTQPHRNFFDVPSWTIRRSILCMLNKWQRRFNKTTMYQILVTTNNYSDISGSLGCKITTDKRLIWWTLPRCSGDDEWSDLCPSLHVSGQYVHQLYHGGQWQHALVFLGYRVRWSPWWLWF